MPVLLGPQPVRKASSGQLHIVVGQDLVLGHVVEELAAFDQPLGEVTLTAHLFSVHRLAVRHVHPILVEQLAGFEVALGDRAHFNRGAAERRGDLVAEEHHSCDGGRCLEVNEMVRDPERVQRTLAHFVEIQIVALFGVRMLGQTEDLDQRRTYRVVDDPAERAELVDVVELVNLHN